MAEKFWRSAERQQTPREKALGILTCNACSSDLIELVDWEEVDPVNWQIEVECMDCGWGCTHLKVEQEVAEEIDEESDRIVASLVSDLGELVCLNTESNIQNLAKALEVGAVIPDDIIEEPGHLLMVFGLNSSN